MHPIDLGVFLAYLLFMIGVGVYYMRKNKSIDDYYVGGRNMTASHIGLSVVATDVGGGFSIGLGGLGFVMGISGSWMLFTGFIGAWLSAALLIPKLYALGKKHGFLTFPQSLAHHYNSKVALFAGIISLIGYIGFSSSQILAGAKLASASFPSLDLNVAIWAMGIIAVGYTVIGGIKAVIYTDTIQWSILMGGLVFIGIPISYYAVGGWERIAEVLPKEFLQLTNLSFVQFFNWFITIVPIWFVGMTLYQRVYSCRDEQTAKKAWRLAAFFEWPIMAFMGVALGLLARVAFEDNMFALQGYPASAQIDAELGLPLLLSSVLPVGLMGLMMSAYFSAIMSTADSCLMAASGNLQSDILGLNKEQNIKKSLRSSQLLTLLIGLIAILLAGEMSNVLDLMLYSYAFMVSGLFVPVLASLFIQKPSPTAAIVAMLSGGGSTLWLILMQIELPYGLDANFFGIAISFISFSSIQLYINNKSYG